jgi:hypothetical protein
MTFREFWQASRWPERVFMVMMVIGIPNMIWTMFIVRDFEHWGFWVAGAALQATCLFSQIDSILNKPQVTQDDSTK